MSAIKPPSYPLIQKQQEDQSNSVPIENEEDRTRKVCLCLCIFQEGGTLGQLNWFFTTQRQRDAPLTKGP